MADEANTQASQDAPAENTAADSATENQTGEQTSQNTEAQADSAGQQESKQESSDASSGDNKQSQDSKTDSMDSKESKPQSRRSAAFRLNQVLKENQELKQQLQEKKPQDAADEWTEDSQADEQPNIAELVQKEVERRLNPVITESSKTADDAEINELFSGQNAADRDQYESRIRSLWNLPQYKDVAASDLLNMLRGSEMSQTIERAKQEAIEQHKQAEKEAKHSSASGTSNSNRSGKGGKSVADMTPAELEEHNQRVIAGQVK